jgi:uncharacterized protein with PQ loop repeat
MVTFEKLYEHYMIVIGSVGHLLFVFQTVKIIQTGCAKDLSLGGFLISFVSLVSWLVYGFLKKDKPLILVNLFGSLAAAVCIGAILIFR